MKNYQRMDSHLIYQEFNKSQYYILKKIENNKYNE